MLNCFTLFFISVASIPTNIDYFYYLTDRGFFLSVTDRRYPDILSM